jgi:deoxyadenosine/deoxycytidine kinase
MSGPSLYDKVIIEGCVAVGKSTIIEAISKARPALFCHPEPLSNWEACVLANGDCVNYLERFYEQPSEKAVRELQV